MSHSSSPMSLPTLAPLLYRQRTSAPEFCDVELKCGVELISAHGCVLAARSDVLERSLRHGSAAAAGMARPTKVQLDVGPVFGGIEHLFQDFVSYLYLGQKPANATDVEMRILGQKLGLKSDFFLGQQQSAQIQQEPATFQPAKPAEPMAVPPKEPSSSTAATVNAATASGPVDDAPMDFSFCAKCGLLFISKDEYDAHNCAKKFTCKTCGDMFARVQQLLEHLLEVRHGETVCSVCDHAVSAAEMEAHIRDHLLVPGKPYLCLQCESRFASRSGLQNHVPKHSAETPFVCQICFKGFKWKHALTAHMVVHSTSKQYLCQECGFETSHTSVLKRHRRIHSGQTLKCKLPDCNFETVRKQNLVQHQLTHSKEKPHQCEVCGKSFSLVKNMRRHSQQHDKNALKYQCRVPNCQFGTIRSDKFVEHMRRHHPTSSEATPERLKTATSDGAGRRKRRKSSPAASSSSTTSMLVAAAAAESAAKMKLESAPLPPLQVATSSAIANSSTSTPSATVTIADVTGPGTELASEASPPPRARLLKNPFDTISPPNRTIANFDTTAFVGIGSASQQSFILSDVALSQVNADADSGNRAAAEAAEAAVAAAAHAAVENALHTIDDLV